MKNIFLFLVITFQIVFASFCFAQSIENELRQKVFMEWIDSARYVAKKADNHLAKKLVDFVEKYGALAVPKEDGFFVLQKSYQEKYNLRILILFQADRKFSQQYGDFVDNQNIGASFNPDNRLMLIRGEAELTRNWKGILFLHECFHAYFFLKNSYDWRDASVFCQNEKDAHDFQHELIVGTGGKEFARFIVDEVDKVKLPVGTSFSHGTIVLRNERLNVDLFFGKSLSEFEEMFRGTALSILINFNLIEKKFREDLNKKKVNVIFERYGRAGLLPDQ